LKFLLKRELRHEDRAANQEQAENKQDIKNSQACQFGECIDRNRENPRERESAMRFRRR
jgi:hypothetical protein